ncbi:MAG: FHA domain-containing protein, partial [Phycisphaerae bacterium]
MAANPDAGSNLPVPRPRSGSAAARAHLESIAGPEKGEMFRVAPGTTLIGRDPSCDVALSESAVSRQHARIEHREDQWTVRNLSPNGTRLNKKSIDEAVLSDGDVIRVGAKTRLRFLVETVAVSLTGRPQFRPRVLEAQEEEAGEEPKGEEEEAKPSLFHRRKGWFIGLGVYLLAILMVGLVLAFRGCGRSGAREIPVLALEDMIVSERGASALRVDRATPDYIVCQDEFGRTVRVPRQDLKSGKAKRIVGIRQAIEGKLQEYKKTLRIDLSAAEAHRNRALDLYDQRNSKAGNLFSAVRYFQKALAYYGGRGYFPNQPTVDTIYLECLREVADRIHREYTNAVLDEKAGEYKRAMRRYKHVLAMVPEPGNKIVENVSRRINALRKRYP